MSLLSNGVLRKGGAERVVLEQVHIHIEKHMVSDIADGDMKSWLDATW